MALKSKDPKDIESFKAIRRKCKKLIRSKYNGYLNDLSKQVSTNPKKFWNCHRSKTKSRRIPSPLIKDENGSQLIIDVLAKANLFNDYFNSVFSQLDTEPPPPGLYPIVPYMSELSFITLSTDEVQKILLNLDPSKSPGPDEITARVLKELVCEIAGSLTCLFNQSLSSGKFPVKWKDANLIPVHKSGPKNNVTNYRGIALLSVVSKVLEKCVFSRIYDHVQDVLNPSQNGFRPNRSCVTQQLQHVHLLASTLDTGGQIRYGQSV